MTAAALTVIGLVLGAAAIGAWAIRRRPHGSLLMRHIVWADRARARQRLLWKPEDDRRPHAVEFPPEER